MKKKWFLLVLLVPAIFMLGAASVQAQPGHITYEWVKQSELPLGVVGVERGVIDIDGNAVEGIRYYCDRELSPAVLERVDIELSVDGYKREGGTSFTDEIIDNKDAIETMSASLPEPEPEVNPVRDLLNRWRR